METETLVTNFQNKFWFRSKYSNSEVVNANFSLKPPETNYVGQSEIRSNYIRLRILSYSKYLLFEPITSLCLSAEYFDTSSHVSQDEHKLLVREFFESDEITILAATKQDSKIQFHHRIPNDQHCLLFYKIPHVGNGQPSVNSLGLLTLEGGMVKSIYNSVARVFSPHVSKVISFWCVFPCTTYWLSNWILWSLTI